MASFQRINIRLSPDRYIGRQSYFVTMCFHERRRYGASPQIAKWIICCLRSHAAACGFLVFAYCVMPDHLHVLAVGTSETSSLIKFIEAFKQATAVGFSARTRRPLWQSKYYDHILRRSDAVDRVAWYIWLNPVRKGLCRAPGDYPFSGAMTPGMRGLLRGPRAAKWAPPWKTRAPANTRQTRRLPAKSNPAARVTEL
jgi:REP element-mobilizing transposase RayT